MIELICRQSLSHNQREWFENISNLRRFDIISITLQGSNEKEENEFFNNIAARKKDIENKASANNPSLAELGNVART